MVGIQSAARERRPAVRKTNIRAVQFCASSWTPDETTRIIASAKAALPTLRTYAVPHGLHDAGGPDGVAAHLAEQAERLLGEGL